MIYDGWSMKISSSNLLAVRPSYKDGTSGENWGTACRNGASANAPQKLCELMGYFNALSTSYFSSSSVYGSGSMYMTSFKPSSSYSSPASLAAFNFTTDSSKFPSTCTSSSSYSDVKLYCKYPAGSSPSSGSSTSGSSKKSSFSPGLVVGPLGAILIIGIGAFFFMRNRNRGAYNAGGTSSTNSFQGGSFQSSAGQSTYQQFSPSIQQQPSPMMMASGNNTMMMGTPMAGAGGYPMQPSMQMQQPQAYNPGFTTMDNMAQQPNIATAGAYPQPQGAYPTY